MTPAVAFALGLAVGVVLMGWFCDWMLAEAQSLLSQSKSLQEEALALVASAGHGAP